MGLFATHVNDLLWRRPEFFRRRLNLCGVRILIGVAKCLVAACLLLVGRAARAQNGADTWIGNTSANWSDSNWSGNSNPPISGDSLIFGAAGTAGTTLNDDLTNSSYNVAGITFNSGDPAYTISGNAFTLTGGITDSTNNVTETINNAISLTASQSFTVATGGNLTLAGTISDTGGGFTQSSTGTLTLSGANTFTGAIAFSGDSKGAVILANPSAVAAGNVSFGAEKSNKIDIATNGGDAEFTISMSTNGTGTIVSDRATAGPGINHTIGAASIGGTTTLTVSAGANVTSGTASLTLTSLNLSAGSSSTTTLKPTSATLSIGSANILSNSASKTLDLDGTIAGNTITGAIANSLGFLHLTKSSTSTWTLYGANTYTGATIVSGGTLNVANASGLGSGSAVTLTGGTLNYDAAANSPLAVASLAIASGATIGGSIGSSTTGAEISATGAATATGAVTVNIFGATGVSAKSGTNTYTLLTGGTGTALNTGVTYALGTIYNASTFTVGALSSTATALQVSITSATAPTTEYWAGGVFSNQWAVTNGNSSSPSSNWSTDTAGASVTSLTPGSSTAVFFGATSATAASQTSMTLGADMSIKSLTIDGTTAPADANPISLNNDGFTLTLAAASGSSITVNSGSGAKAVTARNSLIAISNSQTFTNSSSNVLTINGGISLGGNTLTITGSGGASLNGNINGTGGVTLTGGTLTLAGANSYSGATTISGGTNSTLIVTNPLGAGTGELKIATGATTPVVDLHIDGGGTITMPNAFGSNSSITTTFDVNNNGSGSNGVILLNGALANSGIGTITLNVTGGNGYSLSIANLQSTGGSAGVITFKPTTASLSLGNLTGNQSSGTNTWTLDGTATGNVITGVISNSSSGAKSAVTKSNTSTWTLSGASTYTGATTVNAGTLRVANGITGSATGTATVTLNGGTLAGSSGTGGTTSADSCSRPAAARRATIAPGLAPACPRGLSARFTSTAA